MEIEESEHRPVVRIMEKKEMCKLLLDSLREANIKLTPTVEQLDAIYHVAVEKRDTLLVLPTGSGKSLVFQALPALLRAMGHGKALVLLICPLVSLMKTHKKELQDKFNVQAGILTEADDREAILNGEFPVVMGTPESWIKGQIWRDMLLSPVYQENLFTMVADEVHCVPKWSVYINFY